MLRDQERVTIIVTTHLMEEAERCDRLAILSEGHLVGIGTPAELKQEIGGDVILLETSQPESLARRYAHGTDWKQLFSMARFASNANKDIASLPTWSKHSR